jgi:outer membrane receptor for ferrienterochelin and colicin
VVTLGAFRKKLKDYIVTTVIGIVPTGPDNGFEGNYAGYELNAPTNMGSAEVNGVEFEFRRRLSFLPAALKGLTLSANYTWLSTKGKFTGTVERTTREVVGFVPRSGNVRLFYDYKRFSASASLNYTGEYVVSYSATAPANSYYRRDLRTVSAGISYRLRPNTTINVDASNVFEKGPEQYRYIKSRPRQRTLGMMSLNVGLSGQF